MYRLRTYHQTTREKRSNMFVVKYFVNCAKVISHQVISAICYRKKSDAVPTSIEEELIQEYEHIKTYISSILNAHKMIYYNAMKDIYRIVQENVLTARKRTVARLSIDQIYALCTKCVLDVWTPLLLQQVNVNAVEIMKWYFEALTPSISLCVVIFGNQLQCHSHVS